MAPDLTERKIADVAFFRNVNVQDGVRAFWDALEKAGIKTVLYESPGTDHERLTWRRSLHEFAPLLFRARVHSRSQKLRGIRVAPANQ